MEVKLIAVKCKHWCTPNCPHREDSILNDMLVVNNTTTTIDDIIKADNICKECKSFELYKR